MYSNANIIKKNQNLTATLSATPSRLITDNSLSLSTSFPSTIALAAYNQHKFSSISRTTKIAQGSAVEAKARQKSESSEVYRGFTGDGKNAFFIEKIINLIMRDGEKSKASQIFYNTLTIITEKKFNENSILATSFVSKQGKTKPLVFHKQQVQRVSSPFFKMTASPMYSRDDQYSQSKHSHVFSKVYSPRVYPSTDPLLFNSMLLSDTSRSALQSKTKGFLSSIALATASAKQEAALAEQALREGRPTDSLSSQPKTLEGLLDKKSLSPSKASKAKTFTSSLEAQALLYHRSKINAVVNGVDKITLGKVKHDTKSKPVSSTTLLAVLASLSLTGKYSLNDKLTTFFSVLKAKARSTGFINIVKVLSDALPKSIYNKVSKLSKVNHVFVTSYTPSAILFANAPGSKGRPELLLSTSLAQQEKEQKTKASSTHIKAKSLVSVYAKKAVKLSNSFVVNERQRHLDSHNKQQVALQLVKIAINNVKPSLEVRKVRIAGTTYQVPAILDKKKSISQAIRWIIESARTRKNRSKSTFSVCLAEEFLDAFQKQGKARQKRDQLHNVASANRAYIRYRWW